MRICGTGHRPKSLGVKDPYSLNTHSQLVCIAIKWLMDRPAYDTVISGMAMGWDMALAQAAVSCNRALIAAIPFPSQAKMWQPDTLAQYNELLSKAQERYTISEDPYTVQKMQIRNEWMVDQSDAVLALWNGIPSFSGTAGTIRYAEQRGRHVYNVWDEWLKKRS